MPYTNIDDPSAYFQTSSVWTGGSSTLAITNDGNSDLQPDWVWIKCTNASQPHALVDSSRGTSKYLESASSAAEVTDTGRLQSFDTDGFTLAGNSGPVNTVGGTYVAWQWKANGGTTASNTDGSITSTVQANQDAGFSIGTFTGNGTSGATVGHGLGVKPDMLILKSRNNPSGAAMYWIVGHVGLDGMAGLKNLFMNENWAVNTESAIWGNTAPTSSVFSVGPNAAVNYTGNDMLFYAFANKQGYSKFGKYIGNGSSNGPFVYTGFKPAFVIVKNASSVYDWRMNGPDGVFLSANSNGGVYDSPPGPIDRLSNGFKIRGGDDLRQNGSTFIYMAFAENPFVTSTGIPTTAR